MSVTRRLRDESGATIVTFALILLVLLGFAAVAIDGAASWAQRRQNQSGADTGALAGGIMVDAQPTAAAIADATDEVIRITYNTMDPDMSFAAWTSEWTSCTDPDRPAEYTIVGTSPCVSLSWDLQRIRVNMPTIDVPTTFGKALGRDTIATGAFAEAGTQATFGGGVLPFGLPGAVAGDTEVCLKTGSNPKNVAPCDGPDSGNFAFLDVTQFGSLRLGTSTRCTGDTIDRLARNIMEGADHFLDAAPDPGATPLIDRDVCTDGDFAVEPYTITTETGNKTGVLHDGLVTGLPADGIPGRLTVGTNTVEISGHDIDNTPLWAFLNDDGKALCGAPSNKAQMIACLGKWKPANGVIFDISLDASPRWAWVPLFWENDLGSGNTDRTIREFRPVYLQTTLWKCNASSCSVVHEAGETPVGSGSNLEIEALSALQVPLGALPTAMQKAQPGTDGDREFLLIR